MKIGIPKEIKSQESRVSVVPSGVRQLVLDGHTVIIEKTAGIESGFPDSEYISAGAKLASSGEEVFDSSDMIIKVKEPMSAEYCLIKKNHIVFTYFHFASSTELTRAMQKSGALCIAYETLELPDRSLPMLTPMSEIAGRVAPQVGAWCLEKHNGGSGVLLGGVPGVKPGVVTIVGGGISGLNSALISAGLGARVYILDINLGRLRYLSEILPPNVITVNSNPSTIAECCAESDLVIGAVLIHGAPAPKLINREILRSMRPGSAFVDIAVDQGGCSDTTKPTTHKNPIYFEEGIVHYAVANIPGAVGRTSTLALANSTISYARKIAAKGMKIVDDPEFKSGINIQDGKIIYPALKELFD